MSKKANSQTISLELPERTLTQIDTLIRCGHFLDRPEAIAAAVDRLYHEEPQLSTPSQDAFARLCGALHLGTTPQSLRDAELDRLDWESEQP